jgi:hypothetical protein
MGQFQPLRNPGVFCDSAVISRNKPVEEDLRLREHYCFSSLQV